MATVSSVLFQIEQELTRRGHPPMEAETLRVLAEQLQRPEVATQLTDGTLTVTQLVDQA